MEGAVAPDACNILRVPRDQLARTTSDAKRGDVSAQRRLWDHYLCEDETEALYWQDRLIENNDWQAMATRAETLFFQASDMADNDPRKTAHLNTAKDLEKRARKARGNGVETVLVNGRDVKIPFSSEPNKFTKRLHSEVDRLRER